MSEQSNEQTPEITLKANWDLINKSRTAIANEISSLADTLSGSRARQLASISSWLHGSKNYEAVLERPDVLCFCLAWLDAALAKPNGEALSEFERSVAVGMGFCKFENNAPLPHDLTPFLYPFIAFLIWIGMLTFGSLYILPNFRIMFEEFGIELPYATRYVFGIGTWLEAYWIPFFAVLLLTPIVLWLLLRISQYGKAYSLNWIDRRFSKFRTKLSNWASHVASLLAAGVDEKEAILIAGRCSASSRLQACCDDYVENDERNLIDSASYPLINNLLVMNDRVAKIAILEECARYYRALSGIVSSWWLSWLSKAILTLIVFTLFLAVSAMFMPLISIISGLTG